MVHHSSCPLCFSSDIRERLLCTDHFKSGEIFPLWTCSVCGFTFTQDHPDEDTLQHYYDSVDYISHSDTSGGLVNKIYKAVRVRMLRKKRQIVKMETGLETGTLLDIGSGTGHFAAGMKDAGWTVRGIEINQQARKTSAEKFGLEIISPGEKSALESDSYDCITLWHVLEHFTDLYGYIKEINRLLKPGGTCIIALPNIDSFDAMHYGQFWAAFDVPRHLWHFNPDIFGFLFEGRGFRVVNISPLPLDVFYISILSERYKENSLAFLTGIIKGSYFAFKALFNKRRSSSLIYILKK
jgi:2-polyprenyl-3-methyl-5-hydroxy-6-metoxy-1,4-benzoquinol methylase